MIEPPAPPDRNRPPGVPGWLRLLIVAGLLILLVAVAVTLLTGGGHGPAMHGG